MGEVTVKLYVFYILYVSTVVFALEYLISVEYL